MVVSQINIYPVKGLAAVSVTESMAYTTGFDFDRRWMLLDEQNRFLTQRQLPLMALLTPELTNGLIHIRNGNDGITFERNETFGKPIQTFVWDDPATTLEVNPVVSQWFSDALHLPVKLVRLADEIARMHPSSAINQSIPVSLADAYPYLVLGLKSVAFLNQKLTTAIPADRFRANILIETSAAHEEDTWKTYSLGQAVFQSVKPCGRCTVITIDQKTGEQNNEPLKVLNTYRKKDQNVIFGMHTICLEQGLVKIGDTLSLQPPL